MLKHLFMSCKHTHGCGAFLYCLLSIFHLKQMTIRRKNCYSSVISRSHFCTVKTNVQMMAKSLQTPPAHRSAFEINAHARERRALNPGNCRKVCCSTISKHLLFVDLYQLFVLFKFRKSYYYVIVFLLC